MKIYKYIPVGWDVCDSRIDLKAGELVKKVHPGYGCPPNGTMGHCFVSRLHEGPRNGKLVLLNSLQKID